LTLHPIIKLSHIIAGLCLLFLIDPTSFSLASMFHLITHSLNALRKRDTANSHHPRGKPYDFFLNNIRYVFHEFTQTTPLIDRLMMSPDRQYASKSLFPPMAAPHPPWVQTQTTK
jgi:hypothetical protein